MIEVQFSELWVLVMRFRYQQRIDGFAMLIHFTHQMKRHILWTFFHNSHEKKNKRATKKSKTHTEATDGIVYIFFTNTTLSIKLEAAAFVSPVSDRVFESQGKGASRKEAKAKQNVAHDALT